MARTLVSCPQCGVMLRKGAVNGHLRRVHSAIKLSATNGNRLEKPLTFGEYIKSREAASPSPSCPSKPKALRKMARCSWCGFEQGLESSFLCQRCGRADPNPLVVQYEGVVRTIQGSKPVTRRPKKKSTPKSQATTPPQPVSKLTKTRLPKGKSRQGGGSSGKLKGFGSSLSSSFEGSSMPDYDFD
jgi:hypothetical protein